MWVAPCGKVGTGAWATITTRFWPSSIPKVTQPRRMSRVLDQSAKPIQSANMRPHEKGTFFTGGTYDNDVGHVPGYPTSSQNTAADGTFHDVPFGLCSNLPISDPFDRYPRPNDHSERHVVSSSQSKMDGNRARVAKFRSWTSLEHNYESGNRKRCGQDEVNHEIGADHSCSVRPFSRI